MRTWAVLLLCVGCVAETGDEDVAGGGKADDANTCTDATYGDGTCHVDLACGVPDVDCFKTFTSDEEAIAALAAEGLSPLGVSDPLHAKARAQLDKSWKLFKEGVALGRLADAHLAAVVIPDDSINAYVYPTQTAGVAYFAVNINRGMLQSAMTEDELHGIMFHEIAHLAKLHVAEEVGERLRRYYVAPEGEEPIGATTPEHAQAREAMLAWRKLATFTGVFSDAALANLPYGGTLHDLFDVYYYRAAQDSPQCVAQIEAVQNRYRDLKLSAFDQTIVFPEGFQTAAEAAIAAMKQCTFADTTTFAQLRSYASSYVPTLADELTAEDARLDSMRAFDALLALAADRRQKLLAIEADFEMKTGRPFTAARFFSQEEEADDVSARLTKANALTDRGVSGFLFAAAGEERATCDAALAANAPIPYGRYLIDDHHGDCWRIAHARQLHDEDTTARIELPITRAPEPWVPTRVRRGPIY